MTSSLSLKRIAIAMAFAHTGFAQLNAMTYVGCFSNANGLSALNTDHYQTDGLCQSSCVQKSNAPVLGLTGGNACLCGSQTPNSSAKVDDSKCNTPCTGYGQHMCGGTGFYSVYLTGTQDSVSSVGGGSATSGTTTGPSSASSASPSVITSFSPGQTVVITQSANAQAGATQNPTPGKKTNFAAIGAGVGIGVLALAAIGALILFFRYRRKRAAEAAYKQHQVGDFIAGGKPQIPARKPSGPDSRFDAEAMAHRRLSDGSIADNEDYSRRILKVTNPDHRL